MPKINETLLLLEVFQYAMSLYLNMGCYHIRLIKNVSKSCTINIPWGGCCYKLLPMGIANLPENSQ